MPRSGDERPFPLRTFEKTLSALLTSTSKRRHHITLLANSFENAMHMRKDKRLSHVQFLNTTARDPHDMTDCSAKMLCRRLCSNGMIYPAQHFTKRGTEMMQLNQEVLSKFLVLNLKIRCDCRQERNLEPIAKMGWEIGANLLHISKNSKTERDQYELAVSSLFCYVL